LGLGEAQAFAEVGAGHAGGFLESVDSSLDGVEAVHVGFGNVPGVDLLEHQTEEVHGGLVELSVDFCFVGGELADWGWRYADTPVKGTPELV